MESIITNKTALVSEPVHATLDATDKTPARAVERVVYAGGKYYLTTEKDGVITNTEITDTVTDPRTGRVDLVLPENEAGRKFLTVEKVTADGYTLIPRYGYAPNTDPVLSRSKTDKLPYWYEVLTAEERAQYDQLRTAAIDRMNSPKYALEQQIKKQLEQLQKLQAQLASMQ